MKRFLMTLVLCCLPVWAAAHSALKATQPADGVALAEPPANIGLSFAHDIRLTRVTWTHDASETGQLDLDGHKSFSDAFEIPFEAPGAGTYVIEWRGLGDDGHPQKGIFSFTVE